MSLTDIQEFCLSRTPSGRRYTLVVIAQGKRFLEFPNCPDDVRLKILEHFDRWATSSDSWLDADTIAAIEPMCAEGAEIFHTAMKAGAKKAFDALARRDVFTALCILNPSILAALTKSEERFGWDEGAIQRHMQEATARDGADRALNNG